MIEEDELKKAESDFKRTTEALNAAREIYDNIYNQMDMTVGRYFKIEAPDFDKHPEKYFDHGSEVIRKLALERQNLIQYESAVADAESYLDQIRPAPLLQSPDQQVSSDAEENFLSAIQSYRLTDELPGHTDCVWDICTTFDGNFIAASGHDFSIRSWRFNEGKWEKAFEFLDHKNFVKGLDCRIVDGRIIMASASHDFTVKCFDGNSGVCLWTGTEHTNSVLGTCIGDHLIASTGFSEKSIRLWDLNGAHKSLLSNTFGHTTVYPRFRNPVDCRQIVCAGNEATNQGKFKIFDSETGKVLLNSNGHHEGWVWRVCVSNDGNFAITSSYVHRNIKVWDLRTGETVRTINGHNGGVFQLAICRDRYLISAGQDSNVKVWNWEFTNCINTFPAKSSAFRGAAASPDGRWIAGGGGDKVVFMWS